MIFEIILVRRLKTGGKKDPLFPNVDKFFHETLINIFPAPHMLKRLVKQNIKIPVDQIVLVNKIAIKCLPCNTAQFRQLCHGNVIDRCRLHAFLHRLRQTVFCAGSLCRRIHLPSPSASRPALLCPVKCLLFCYSSCPSSVSVFSSPTGSGISYPPVIPSCVI